MKNFFTKLIYTIAKPITVRTVVGTAVLAAALFLRVPQETDAMTCVAAPLYPCPSTITIWGNVTASFYKYGAGSLPNGDAFCGYYAAPSAPGAGGDAFVGAYDRVLGRQVTYARRVSCTTSTCYDVDGLPYSCSTCTRLAGFTDINPINQGTKCQDPTPSPSDLEGGTDSWFWINHDCWASGSSQYSSWNGWFAWDSAGGTGYRCYSASTNPSCSPYSVSPAAENFPAQQCVDVHF